jgi:hypothetical protein
MYMRGVASNAFPYCSAAAIQRKVVLSDITMLTAFCNFTKLKRLRYEFAWLIEVITQAAWPYFWFMWLYSRFLFA